MLKISVFAIGKLKENYWREASAEYLKRLSAYAKVEIRELPDSNPRQEASLLLDALPASPPCILLDIQGTPTSSETLADKLESCMLNATTQLVFIIGGSEGVTEEVRACATELLSFGPITLPHNLARIVLLEQLYRAFKILRGEPYHK